MKAYKMEILVIDFDEIGGEEIKSVIRNAHYPNHCIEPDVKEIEGYDIGEWTDDHPLNKRDTCDEYYRQMVSKNREGI